MRPATLERIGAALLLLFALTILLALTVMVVEIWQTPDLTQQQRSRDILWPYYAIAAAASLGALAASNIRERGLSSRSTLRPLSERLTTRKENPMSTNAYIGIEGYNGRITYVYVHGDGGLEPEDCAGPTLRERYISRDLVWELVARGNMSSLYPPEDMGENHYATWAGEKADDCIAAHAEDRAAFWADTSSSAWRYLFTLDDEWLVAPIGSRTPEPLAQGGDS